jgi:hypothetical protein
LPSASFVFALQEGRKNASGSVNRQPMASRLFMLALALATVLSLSASQAGGAKTRRAGGSCTSGASSTHVAVLDGRIVPVAPTAMGCTSR